jgi:NTP pyrophosphatase (non-canonical NTP hydrolase)
MKTRTLDTWQKEVDQWINQYGVRYFDVKTNALLMAEESGEVCRLIARIYGEQSFKTELDDETAKWKLKEELADLLFVITCICNQLDIDINEALDLSMAKKTKRDQERHIQNEKLRD